MKNLFSMVIGLFLVSPVFAWKVTTLRDTTGVIKMEVDVAHGSTQLDVLFVVDNSASMTEYQQNLSNSIGELIGGLIQYDVHAAVVTTDEGDGGRFVNGVLNSKNTNFLAQLRQDILQGADGNANEQLFSPVITALTPPLSITHNKDFLRDNADLIVVFLTDAEDQSKMGPDEFVARLKAIKANTLGTISTVAIYAAVNSKCPANEDAPVNFENALVQLKAKTVLICDPQLAKSLNTIGGSLTSGMVSVARKIKLPLAPELNTMKVTYGLQQLQMGDFYQGWMYDTKTTMLMIGEDFNFKSEPVGTKLLIEYTPKEWIK